ATVAPEAKRDRIAQGISASPGAAVGRLAFTSEQAQEMAQREEPSILVCVETKPEDVQGMHAAVGVLTLRGGLTSHAAVVARGLGRPCVVGAGDARLDVESQTLQTADGRSFSAGATVTLDGSAGEALAGALPTLDPEPSGDFATLMTWADGFRRMGVRANADTPADAETARRLGVDGIGLCRTEHMFVEPVRITAMREMILADSEEARRAALAKLLPMQRADFALLFTIMSAEDVAVGEFDEAPPVTIRLLDPPLHEFLPKTQDGYERLAMAMDCSVEKIIRRADELKEFNPMLGKRGCRVGVAFPEIYEMQARAIFEAALDVEAAGGRSQRPEIMIPLVTAVREFEVLRDRVDNIAQQISIERGASFDYSVGIMVETPRAALRAGALGQTSAFFSFGTNDLTQMTYGLSRDDAGRLMRDYVERGVFEADPFQSLDQEGVGELMEMAVERGRAVNPDLSIGLCGEHGGDPATIDFCERIGCDYVSCSPFRAPIARLAAAQAALSRRDKA
ncbi:MAG: pyruvate, phosphate dikinase, partial [Rhodobacteraceae bacterium]|nr:pyruvate, phosphate dikinase [Paracoccaceae bacterium]